MAVTVLRLWFQLAESELLEIFPCCQPVKMFDSKIKHHDNPSVLGWKDKRQQQRLKRMSIITHSFRLVVIKNRSAQNQCDESH